MVPPCLCGEMKSDSGIAGYLRNNALSILRDLSRPEGLFIKVARFA